MGNVAYAAPEVQCSVNRNPSPPFSSVTQLPGGGYRVVFAPIASLPANGEFVATYRAFMRNTYEGGGLDGQPTVSGDNFVNTVTSVGATTGIADIQPPGTTFPSDVWGTVPDISDGSSATLTTTALSLDKQLLPRNVVPRLDASSPVVDRCPNPSAPNQYIDADTPATAADVDARGFRLGDQICFRLRVDFSDQIRTRNPVVTDFVPPGTEFLAGSIRATTANTTPYTVVEQSAAGPVVFAIGTPEGSNRFVNIGGVFDVVFAVEVTEVPVADDPLLSGNLMKMRTENSAGQAQSYRDVANFGIIPPPPIGVVKGVASVNTPANGPNAANSNVDGVQVRQGSQVRFRIDLTNLGVPADFNNYSARELEVLDVLPDEVGCSSISAITNFGMVTNLGECLDPGETSSDTSYTNSLPGGVSVIRWAFDESDDYALFPADAPQPPDATAAGTRSLLYTLTIPTPTSVSTRFDNTAGVRSYGGFTNLQGIVSPSFIPADNIDPAIRPQANAPAADDDSWVRTPDAAPGKLVTTWIQETNNNTSTPAPPAATRPLPVIGTSGQAVIGEFVTYRYYIDIPAQTTVFQGALTDPMPTSLTLVTAPPAPIPAPSLTFFPDAASTVTAAVPPGISFTPTTGAVAFGASYTNTTVTTQRFEVILSARVTTAGLSDPTSQVTRTNTARFRSVDGDGVQLPDRTSSAGVQIRQPLPDVTKAASSSLVNGGDTVTFTLTASTAGGRPPLHDTWLEDCVPVGLENVALVPAAGTTIGPLTGAAATAEGCDPGETYLAFGLGTLAPGAAGVVRQYTAQVSLSAVGGQQYENTVDLSGSSLNTGNSTPGADDPAERVYRDSDTVRVTVRGAGVTKTVDPGQARIGERVEFSVTVDIPPNTNFFQATVVDRLPLGLVDPLPVAGYPTCTLQPIAAPCPDPLSVTVLGPVTDATPVPPLQPASVYGLLIGDITASPQARRVEMRYTTRVADIASNVDGVALDNVAQTRWDGTNKPDPTNPLTNPWDYAGAQTTATVEVIEPNVTVAKAVSDTTPDPGQLITYTLTVRNTGTSEAYDTVVTDTLPVGVELVGSPSIPGTYNAGSRTITWDADDFAPSLVLAPGAQIQLTYEARLAPSSTIGTSTPVASFRNTAAVTNFESLPSGGRVDTGNTTTLTVTPQFPTLTVDKTVVTAPPAYIGTPVTWRVAVRNAGTSAASSVDIADSLPSGWVYVAGSTTITRPGLPNVTGDPTVSGGFPLGQRLEWDDVGTLLSGQEFVVTFRATPTSDVLLVPPTPFPGGSRAQVNTAEASGVDTSGASGNLDGPYEDSDDAQSRIDSADVRVVKTNIATPAVAGANHTWSVAVSNTGPNTAVGPFTVTDTLPTLSPTPLTFVSATGTGWSCSESAGVVTCARTNSADTLASGASFPSISIVVRPPAEYLGTMTNSVTVGSRTYDPNTANNSSTVDVPVVGRADLEIVKTRTAGAIVAGRTVTYNLAVTNLGPSTSRETITVTDTLPAGTTFVSAPTAGAGDPWDCTHTAGVVTCTLLQSAPRAPFGDLLAGAAAPAIPITITVPASTAPGTTLTNTAVVTPGATPDPVPANNTSTNVGTVTALADLAIQKSATGTLVAGEPATYRLRVDNLGPSDAAAPRISDTLPAGLTYLGFTSIEPPTGAGAWNCVAGPGNTSFTCDLGGPLTAGAFAEVDVRVAVSPTVTGTIVNTATVSSTTPDPVPGNNTDDDASPFDTVADLRLVKTGPATPVLAGDSFTWALQVTNLGPSVSRQPITVTDTLPAGVAYTGFTGAGWSCANVPSALPGVSSVVTCTLATDIGFPAPGNAAPALSIGVDVLPGAGPALLVNTAFVTGTTTDPDLDNNDDSHTVTIVDGADLQVVKTPTNQTVVAGERATFTLAVANNGPSTADNVVLTDTLPSGLTFVLPIVAPSPWDCATSTAVLLTCTLDTLVPGPAPAVTVEATVGSGVADGTTLVNETAVTSSTPDGNLANNNDTADVDVVAQADLAVTKSHPVGAVQAGDDVEFTIAVENLGPSDARADVVVVDTLPPGFRFVSQTGPWTCVPRLADPRLVDCTFTGGALVAGTTTTFAMTVAIESDVTPGQYDNEAVVSSPTFDPNLANNVAIDPVEVTILADVSVVKTHDPATVVVGQDVVFTLTVANDGPSDAQGVVVTDTLPAGLTLVSAAGSAATSVWDCSATAAPTVSCSHVGALPARSVAETILVTAAVLPSAYPGVDNVAVVNSTTPDPDVTNNTSTDSVVVPPLVDLSITKTHADPVAVGATITYTIVVTNDGPTPDPGPVVISDALPDSLRPVAATSTDASCGIVLQTVLCTRNAPLPVGGTVTARIVADVLPAAYPSVTNVALVSTSSTETNLSNNTATDTATVAPLVRLALVKTLGSAAIGSATWLMTVTNLGPNATVQPIVLVDELPAGLTYVSASGMGWVCTHASSRVECTYAASLAVGASAPVVTLVTTVTASPGASIVNAATVNGGGPDVPSVSDDARLAVPAPLPSTGSSSGSLLQVGMMLGLFGVLMLVISRLRRPARMSS
jgi:uncharacterized repeat protein (TIGR01451 family)